MKVAPNYCHFCGARKRSDEWCVCPQATERRNVFNNQQEAEEAEHRWIMTVPEPTHPPDTDDAFIAGYLAAVASRDPRISRLVEVANKAIRARIAYETGNINGGAYYDLKVTLVALRFGDLR